MKVTLNNEVVELNYPTTIKMLIKKLNQNTFIGKALAVNEVVIPKTQWNEYLLRDGDNIVLFQIITGG